MAYDNKNLANTDVSADDIHKMADAARRMADSFKDVNKELSTTAALMSQMNKLNITGASIERTAARAREAAARQTVAAARQTRSNMAMQMLAQTGIPVDKFTRKTGSKRLTKNEKIAKSFYASVATARAQEEAMTGTGYDPFLESDMLKNSSKKVQRAVQHEKNRAMVEEQNAGVNASARDKNATAGIAVLVKILRDCIKAVQKQTEELRKLNQQFGTTTGSTTAYIGSNMSTQLAADAATNAKEALSSSLNNLQFIVNLLKKIHTDLVEGSDTLNQYVSITQAAYQQLAYQTGAQLGIDNTASNQIYHTARSVALMRMRDLYPDNTDAELLATDAYQTLYNSLLSAIMNGGSVSGSSLSTTGWEGWAAENLGWNPNVDYSNQATADARRQYIEYLAGLSDEDKAERIKYYNNQTRLLKQIAGQVFSFDEVETEQAISFDDSVDMYTGYGDELTSSARTREQLLKDLKEEYGLTDDEIANVEMLMDDYGFSVKQIEAMAAAGFKFDSDQVDNIVTALTDCGYSADDVVKAVQNGIEFTKEDIEAIKKLTTEVGLDAKYVNALYSMLGGDWNSIISYCESFHGDMEALIDAINDWIEATGYDTEPDYGETTADKLEGTGSSGTATSTYTDDVRERLENGESVEEAIQNSTADTKPSFWTGVNTSNKWPSTTRKFATGGIGTSPVTNATLFENGPEAVIPLSSDIGTTFMAEALEKAGIAGISGGDTYNFNIDGPVFTENDRQLNKWAAELGDRYQQVKSRRGGN